MRFFKKKSKSSEKKKETEIKKKKAPVFAKATAGKEKAKKDVKEKVTEKLETKKEQKPQEEPRKELVKKKEKQKPEKKIEQKPVQKLSKKATKIAYNILIRPIITEKATFGETHGVYTFEIAPHANKILVKQAIRELYNVEPVKVNIILRKGKQVRYGRTSGRTKNRKRAIVYLKLGDKIEFAKK